MSISPARREAYRVLRRVESSRSFAIDGLQSSLVSRLSPADRNLAVELVMGVLRWRGDLDSVIEQLSARSLDYFDLEILAVLRLGVYQIRFLTRIPKAAAVNESVELAKAAGKGSAAGLVNAVLRKCEERGLASLDPADPHYAQSAQRSVPAWMRERWERHFGPEAAGKIILASQAIPSIHLRILAPADDREVIRQELAASGVETRAGAFGGHALVVESGNLFASPVWREGRVVIQEEGSQLAANLVNPKPSQTILDLCAAPGVKTGQLAASLLQGKVVACDRSLRRMKLMKKVLPPTWPCPVQLHRVVLNATMSLPFLCQFDAVLADVPCSGTGTLARNPEVKWRLEPADLPRLAEMQAKILRHALACVSPGGRVVYVTCSLEPEENEQVIQRSLAGAFEYSLLKGSDLRREFPFLATLIDGEGYFRTRPDERGLGGFFAAVIVRTQ